jgi:hypothetical protein
MVKLIGELLQDENISVLEVKVEAAYRSADGDYGAERARS